MFRFSPCSHHLLKLCSYETSGAVSVSTRLISNLVPKEPDKNQVSKGLEALPAVTQKQFKWINVDHHGVSPTLFNEASSWIPVYFLQRFNLYKFGIRIQLYMSYALYAIAVYDYWHIAAYKIPSFTSHPLLLAVTTTAFMAFAGSYTRRLICRVYISPDREHIRIARLTWAGNRRDMVLPKSIIVPLKENNSSNMYVFNVNFQRPNSIDFDYDGWEFYEETFYIATSRGIIYDLDKFEDIFGKLPHKIV